MPLDKEKIIQLIQAGGRLSRIWKGFEPRLQQQEMLANVIDAYNSDQIALIEAGTGTGKSLAYLIPAMIWASRMNERTVISTHTISLQEQLIQKDIPQLMGALNLQLKAVLVKGINNYICLRKLEDAQNELLLFPSEEKEEIQKIVDHLPKVVEGSRSELPFVPSSSVWDNVGAESEACLHHDCPHYQQCYFFKARKQAQDAHLLVANHHLLFADLLKRADLENYDETAIMPPYRRIVLDEAHHIEDIATDYFASRLNRLELMKILGKLAAEKSPASHGKLPILKEKIQLAYHRTPPREVSQILNRLTIDLPALRHQLNDKIFQAFDAFATFIGRIKLPFHQEDQQPEKKLRLLDEHQKHPQWNTEIIPQALTLMESLKEYHQVINSVEVDLKHVHSERLHEQTKGTRIDIQAQANRLHTAIAHLNQFFSLKLDPL